MNKYDKILMGNEADAIKFLVSECNLETRDAFIFLKRYRSKKEYELMALSMEVEVVNVQSEISEMNEFIEKNCVKTK